jgi:anti-repressor protein
MSHENTNYPGLVPPDDEGPELTMSSREIAELTDRSHDRVMKIIRRTLEVLRKDPDQFLHTVAVIVGDPGVSYRLPRRECEDVIDIGAAFTEEQDNAILRRWDQMEALQKGAHIKAYAERLRAERATQVAFDPRTADEIVSSTPGIILGQGVSLGDNAGRQAAQEATPPLGPVRQMAREDGRQRSIIGFEKITEDAAVPPSIVPHDPQPDATFAIAVKDGPLGVDLRELHRELESKQQFADWAKSRLSQFVEGEDFVLLHNAMKQSGRGGHNRTEYAVSIDCAKHIAMMEQTERGKQVRRYFIECEKALRAASNPTAPALPQTRAQALRELADAVEQNERQAQQLQIQTRELAAKDEQLEEQRPKVRAFDKLMDSDGLYGMASAAQQLRISRNGKTPLGQNGLFAFLREEGILKVKGDSWNLPQQWAINLGYFEVKPGTRSNHVDLATGLTVDKPTNTTKVTPKGLLWLEEKYAHMSLPRNNSSRPLPDDEYDIEDS